MKVIFLGEHCNVMFHKYIVDSRIAIRLVTEDGEPMATATVNIPNVTLNPYEVLIKDYSENEGMWEALVDGNVIDSQPRGVIVTGHATVNIAKLTEESIAHLTETI